MTGSERWPTAAWDMQKFRYNVINAGNVKYGTTVVGKIVQIKKKENAPA